MEKCLAQRAADVLLAVGGGDDMRQIRTSLQQAKMAYRLHHVGDAVEARSYLRREEPYTRAPRPRLVLLDASLPQKSVIDLIVELKTDLQFAEIPVIVLVASESELHLIANCPYAVDGITQKPFNLPDLEQILV